MAPIATYVFVDVGSYGVLDPKITELHMIAIKCRDLQKHFKGGEEFHKNELHCKLENDTWRDIDANKQDDCNVEAEAIEYLRTLEKPVCLIAHNGNRFDFPKLNAALPKLYGVLLEDITANLENHGNAEAAECIIVCADNMHAFYDILEPDSLKTSYQQRGLQYFPWPGFKGGYGLEKLYETVFGESLYVGTAKDRNEAVLKLALSRGFEFMWWVAENNHPMGTFMKVPTKEDEDEMNRSLTQLSQRLSN